MRSEAGAGDTNANDPPPGAAADQLPPPPRPVRRRPGRGRLLGNVPLLVRLLVLAGLGLLMLALWLLASHWAVLLFGATVPAEVTAKVPPLSKGGPSCTVQFTYHLGEEEYSAAATLDDNTCTGVFVGTPLKLKVLPAWPRHPRLLEPRGRAGRDAVYFLGIALLWNAGTALLLWWCLRRPWAQRSLVREGVATAGVVVHKETAGGRRPSFAVQYSYTAPRYGVGPAGYGGEDVRDREWQVLMPVRQQDFEAVQVGTAVTVLYDSRQPSRSLVYVFAEYEAVGR